MRQQLRASNQKRSITHHLLVIEVRGTLYKRMDTFSLQVD